MLKTIALDDEPPALKVLANFCSKVDFIDLQKTFTNTENAYKYISDNTIDLIFLDINMPAVSGIDFYKSLHRKPILILTTAHSEFALEAFNVSALDYLLKPFTFDRFLISAEKARHLHQLNKEALKQSKQEYLLLRINYSLTKILLDDIIYIESLDDYLKIHFKQQKPLVVRITMKSILEKLPTDEFIRVHRSFIIALNKVESVRNKMIIISGKEIPIGISYTDEFSNRFNH